MPGKRAALLLLFGGMLVIQLVTGAATAYVAVKVERLSSVSSELPSGSNDEDAMPTVQRVSCMSGKKVPAFKIR